MRSDRDFLTFLKGMLKGRRLVFVLGVLALVVFLIASGKSADEESEVTRSDTEARIEALCSRIDGVGECSVAVVYEQGDDRSESEGRVYSIAVICEGGDNIRVRAALTELLTSLYGIGSNRVSIMKLEK